VSVYAGIFAGRSGGAPLRALLLSAAAVPEDAAASIAILGRRAGSTLAVASGSLPAGMTLNSGPGTITGTPPTPGTSNFEIDETLGAFTRRTALSVVVEEAGNPSVPASALTQGTQTASLSASTGTGAYILGDPWAIVAPGLTLTGFTTPSSDGLLNGAMRNSGNAAENGVPILENVGYGAPGGDSPGGYDNRDTGYAFSGARNIDPGKPGGVPIDVSAPVTITKAVSRLTGAIDRALLTELRAFTFVSSAPPADAFRPAPADPSKAWLFRDTDILDADLSALPTATIASPPTYATVLARLSLVYDQQQTGISTNQRDRVSYDANGAGGYQADIVEQLGDACVLLCASLAQVSLAQKRALARAIVQIGIDIAGRVRQGGRYGSTGSGPYTGPNGHLGLAAPAVALAAWFVRGSANAAYLTDLLGATWWPNLNQIAGPRPIVQQDWLLTTQVREITVAPEVHATPQGYGTFQCRPFQEGSPGLPSSGGPVPSTAGRMALRLGRRSYGAILWGTGFPVWTLLNRMGARGLIPRADFWSAMDMMASIQLNNASAVDTLDGWITTYFKASYRQLLTDGAVGWAFPATAAPTVVGAYIATKYTRREQLEAGDVVSFSFRDETWLWVEYDQLLDQEAWGGADLPGAAAWTGLTRNGSPVSTEADGVYRARAVYGRSVAIALPEAETAQAGQTWEIAGFNPGTLRSANGQVLPSLGVTPITVRSAALVAPAAELVSFGGIASEPNDLAKIIFVKNNVPYVAVSPRGAGPYFNSAAASPTPFRKLLVGFRAKIAAGQTVAGLSGRILFAGANSTTSFRCRVFNTSGSVRFDGGASGFTRNFTFANAIEAGDIGVERLWWFYIDDANGVYLMRKDGAAAVAGSTSGASWVPGSPEQWWHWRDLLGDSDNGAFTVSGIEQSGLAVDNPFPAAWRWFWLTTGSTVRDFTMPGGNNLDAANFGTGQALGDRGESILSGHLPELFFPVTLEGARNNIFLNYGLLDGLAGSARDDEGELEWFPG
jgi:hypothetical protein